MFSKRLKVSCRLHVYSIARQVHPSVSLHEAFESSKALYKLTAQLIVL